MSELQVGGIILAVTTVVLLSGLPIAFGLALVAVGFLVAFEGTGSLIVVGRTFLTEISSFAILSIPMFVLLGSLIGATRAGVDIFESLHRWLSRVPGGLAAANIGACGLFSALCGSSPATAAAIGKVGVPEMLKRGVKPSLATGAIAAGGTLGILIPPSVTMILYGVVTETSIGQVCSSPAWCRGSSWSIVLSPWPMPGVTSVRGGAGAPRRAGPTRCARRSGRRSPIVPLLGDDRAHRRRDVWRLRHSVRDRGARPRSWSFRLRRASSTGSRRGKGLVEVFAPTDP